MSERPRFHLAFPVHDLNAARAFYGQVLGCLEGRSAPDWVDFDFFGHQIVAHLSKGGPAGEGENDVGGDNIPVRHFGVILTVKEWRKIAENLARQGVVFLLDPKLRFQGEPGEQYTFFVADPSGNALEFKAFEDEGRLFAK